MNLLWESGTAYDFFISLDVLHHPGLFGLRPSWAAGMRSRLNPQRREFLEFAQQFLLVPLAWLHQLPAGSKTVDAALTALAALPPQEILPTLTFSPDLNPETAQSLRQKLGSSVDPDTLAVIYRSREPNLRRDTLEAMSRAWQSPLEFGQRYLEALRAYQDCFFAEEEKRIAPCLQSGLEAARRRAEQLPLTAVLDELTHGLEFDRAVLKDELVLCPSYWSSPLVYFGQVKPGRMMLVFGVRGANEGIVPGDVPPTALVDALKALADPTRLRILRYLAGQPLTPSELAKRLRLRPPTIVHHLNELRLAGVVRISVNASGDRRYTLRREGLEDTLDVLQGFLAEEK